MAEPRGPAGKNVVVEGVHALPPAEMLDATVKAVEERGVRCHQALRIAA